jgi:ADP-ribose pyrophosphatase
VERTIMATMETNRTLLQTRRFSVEEVWQELPGGERRPRSVVRHPGSVVIIPMVDENHVCLIRNVRIAIGRALLELPAGTLDTAEDPMQAAIRELAEETGYHGGTWSRVQGFWASPGILDERMHLFRATALQPGPPAREPGEEIENVVLDWEQAMTMVRQGEIEDAKTLIGLLLEQNLRNHGG